MKEKRQKFKYRGIEVQFIPEQGGGCKNAYIRIETRHKEIICFDNSNIKQSKKLNVWLSKIIKANL